MAGTYDTTVDQGSTWKMATFVTDESGAAINLTGYSARMFVKREKTDVVPLLQLTNANGKIVITELSGRLDFMLLDADTDSLSSGVHFYDIELVSPSGEVTRIVEGVFYINQGVTR